MHRQAQGGNQKKSHFWSQINTVGDLLWVNDDSAVHPFIRSCAAVLWLDRPTRGSGPLAPPQLPPFRDGAPVDIQPLVALHEAPQCAIDECGIEAAA